MEIRTRWWNRRTLSSLPLMRTPKSQLLNNHWWKKSTGTYQKRYSTFKDIKKEPQQESSRGTPSTQSNPISAGWVTCSLRRPAEVLPREWELWVPHQAPQAGGLALHAALECRSSAGLQEAKTPLLEGIPRSCVTKTQGKSSDFIGAWARPT